MNDWQLEMGPIPDIRDVPPQLHTSLALGSTKGTNVVSKGRGKDQRDGRVSKTDY